MPPPPTPFHILRAHQAPLSAIRFTAGNTHLVAGDQDGTVSITDLRARRVIASWKAHDGGILGLGEWDGGIVTQGRDNKVHFFAPLASTSPSPEIVRALDANSLNFCAFSLVPLSSSGDRKGKGKETEAEGLLALPNLADSELIDIYHVPSMVRIHAAVNYVSRTGTAGTRSGLVMALHLGVVEGRIGLVAAYEDGRVEVWVCAADSIYTAWDGRKSDGEGVWKRLWEGKCHNEAVMAMAVDGAFARAFTVSADHLLVRVDVSSILASCSAEGTTDIFSIPENRNAEDTISSYSTKQVGNGAVAVSADGRVVAVGGWDGRIRLFSTATFKPLGTLSYHRESVHCLAFAHASTARAVKDIPEIGADDDDSVSDEEEETIPRHRWLASGGKDCRVALWGLMDFGG